MSPVFFMTMETTANETKAVEAARPSQPPPWSSYLADFAKITIAIAFILYVVGYIVWTAHLGRYGVSPPAALLRVEFVSGALCYLVLLASFAIPVATLANRVFPMFRLKGEKPRTYPPLWLVLILWIPLIMRLQQVYFPNKPVPHGMWTIIFFAVAGMGLIHLCVAACLLWKMKNARPTKWFTKSEWFLAYGFFAQLTNFMGSSESGAFFVSLILLYVVGSSVFGFRFHEYWTSMSTSLRMLCCIIIALLLVANIRDFGLTVFGKIPRNIGGGTPERGFLKISSGHEDITRWISADSSNLLAKSGAWTNAVITNSSSGFIGPVWILFRSDKDTIFITSTNKLSRAKGIRSELIEAIEFSR